MLRRHAHFSRGYKPRFTTNDDGDILCAAVYGYVDGERIEAFEYGENLFVELAENPFVIPGNNIFSRREDVPISHPAVTLRHTIDNDGDGVIDRAIEATWRGYADITYWKGGDYEKYYYEVVDIDYANPTSYGPVRKHYKRAQLRGPMYVRTYIPEPSSLALLTASCLVAAGRRKGR